MNSDAPKYGERVTPKRALDFPGLTEEQRAQLVEMELAKARLSRISGYFWITVFGAGVVLFFIWAIHGILA